VLVGVLPALPVLPPVAVLPLVGAVPVDVEDGVPLVELVLLGSLGTAGVVPFAPDAEVGVEPAGELPGLVGSVMLGGLPGPYKVLSWSGSSVWVSGAASGKLLTLERERR